MNEYDFARLVRSQRVDIFTKMVEDVAERDEVFSIVRDGKPIAVVISPEAYEQLKAAYVMQAIR